MQELTRIIGSIHPTGILPANCFIFRVVDQKYMELLNKVSEN